MPTNVGPAVAALDNLTVTELRERYAEVLLTIMVKTVTRRPRLGRTDRRTPWRRVAGRPQLRQRE